VIRDTHAAADDGQLGQGIVVRDQGDTAGQLTLRDALVSANTYGGVYVSGSSATLERVTVRDTAPATADDEYGVGVSIVGPGSLSLSDCVVSGNRLFGVIAVDAEATLERCVVRDTGPQASDERYGVGVVGRGVASRAKVTLVESVVSGNTTVGAVGETCDLTLERSVVRDTLQEPASGDFGGGISASKDSTLTLTESLVAANRHAGVLVDGGAAKIARSAVRDTEQMASSSGFGDGLQLGNAELSLSDSQVQGSARAGCVAFASSGSIARSLFRGGVFAVDLEKGSTIEVDELTVFADNVENQVTFGQQLQPAPAPLLPPP